MNFSGITVMIRVIWRRSGGHDSGRTDRRAVSFSGCKIINLFRDCPSTVFAANFPPSALTLPSGFFCAPVLSRCAHSCPSPCARLNFRLVSCATGMGILCRIMPALRELFTSFPPFRRCAPVCVTAGYAFPRFVGLVKNPSKISRSPDPKLALSIT